LKILKETDKYHLVEEVYHKCKAQTELEDKDVRNFVKDLYAEFTDEAIENKISELVCDASIKSEVKIIFQPVENLHRACPKNLGDWYFTGNYPTPGGNRVVNRSFINFYEGNKERAY
jgi:amidophosphoribosyltransferase